MSKAAAALAAYCRPKGFELKGRRSPGLYFGPLLLELLPVCDREPSDPRIES
jgi:hypothetical protein